MTELASVNRALAALSTVCTYAVKELSWLPSNPVRRVSKLKEPTGRVRFLSADELPRFLAECRASTNKNLYLAAVLSLTTGGRQSEVMGLRWSQIDLDRRTATLLATKNGDARALPLAGEALALLRARAQQRKDAKVQTLRDREDRLFPPKPGSKSALGHEDLRAPFTAALKRAGLGSYVGEGKRRRFVPDFRWHDLRHTCASYHAMNGTSPLEISKILGHRTMAMVARYAHLAPDRIVELGDALATRLGVA